MNDLKLWNPRCLNELHQKIVFKVDEENSKKKKKKKDLVVKIYELKDGDKDLIEC